MYMYTYMYTKAEHYQNNNVFNLFKKPIFETRVLCITRAWFIQSWDKWRWRFVYTIFLIEQTQINKLINNVSCVCKLYTVVWKTVTSIHGLPVRPSYRIRTYQNIWEGYRAPEMPVCVCLYGDTTTTRCKQVGKVELGATLLIVWGAGLRCLRWRRHFSATRFHNVCVAVKP